MLGYAPFPMELSAIQLGFVFFGLSNSAKCSFAPPGT